MSQAPMPLDTTQGYAPPIVTQFSVFLPNRVGKLLDLVESFDGSACSICALSVHEGAADELARDRHDIAREPARRSSCFAKRGELGMRGHAGTGDPSASS